MSSYWGSTQNEKNTQTSGKKWILTSQLPVVIIRPDVADEGAAIHNEFIEKTVNFAGRLTLDESAVVLSHARHIVTIIQV